MGRGVTSAMIEKFTGTRGLVASELLDLNRTGNTNNLVSLVVPKFAWGPSSELWRTSEQGH